MRHCPEDVSSVNVAVVVFLSNAPSLIHYLDQARSHDGFFEKDLRILLDFRNNPVQQPVLINMAILQYLASNEGWVVEKVEQDVETTTFLLIVLC